MSKFKAETVTALPSDEDREANTLYVLLVDPNSEPPVFDLWWSSKENIIHQLSSQDVAALSATVSALSATVSALSASLSALQDDVSENTTAIGNNTTAIGNNATAISNNANAIQANSDAIASNSQGIAANASDITSLQNAINTTDNNVSTISNTVGAIDSDLTTLQETVTGVDSRLTTAENDISSLETATGNISTTLSALDSEAIKTTSGLTLEGTTQFDGPVVFSSGIFGAPKTVTGATYPTSDSDNELNFNTTGESNVVTLHTPSVNGFRLRGKKVSSDANTVIIQAPSNGPINGVDLTTIVLDAENEYFDISYNTVTGWEIISTSGTVSTP